MFSYSFDHKVTNIFTVLRFILDKNYSWPLNSTSLNYASLLIHRFFFHKYYSTIRAFQVALVLKNLSASARDTRDTGSIPGLGRSPGEGNGNALQYSCLENSIDRGAWWAAVHGTTEGWTWLSHWTHTHTHTHTHTIIHGWLNLQIWNHGYMEFWPHEGRCPSSLPWSAVNCITFP